MVIKNKLAKVRTGVFVAFIGIVAAMLLLGLAGYVFVAVPISASMAKNIPVGSFVVFVNTGNYHVGDVIAFKVCNCLVMHRIVEITPDGYKTKGDDNNSTDPWVIPENATRGKVLFAVPFAGTLMLMLKSPFVFATLATLIFVEMTRNSWGSDEEKKPDENSNNNPSENSQS